MEGRATFLIKGEVAIGVKFPTSPDITQEDIQDEAWSALVTFINNNHEVVYSFEKVKMTDAAVPTESDSDEGMLA
jgi:hypothetical protein